MTAQALPYHNVLLENSVRLAIDSRFDASLTRALPVTVPSPAAFVYVKGLTWERRDDTDKKTKDLAYIVDLLARYPTIREDVIRELPGLSARYAGRWSRRFRSSLDTAFSAPGSIWARRVAEQLRNAGLRQGSIHSVAQEAFVVVREVLNDLASTQENSP